MTATEASGTEYLKYSYPEILSNSRNFMKICSVTLIEQEWNHIYTKRLGLNIVPYNLMITLLYHLFIHIFLYY